MQRLVFLLSATLLLLAATAAWGFTPDEDELSGRMAKEYGTLSSWSVDVSFPGHPGVMATIWQNGSQWRQEWTVPGQKGKAVSVGYAGQAASSCPVSFPLPLTLLWNMPSPLKAWKQLGIDSSMSGFGFHGDSPSFILGSDTGEDDRPQVWLNNEDMSLLRIRVTVPAGDMEFLYSEYTMLGGFMIPGVGTVLLPDGNALDFSMKWSQLNKAADPALYDAQTVRQNVVPEGCIQPPEPFGILASQFSTLPSLRD